MKSRDTMCLSIAKWWQYFSTFLENFESNRRIWDGVVKWACHCWPIIILLVQSLIKFMDGFGFSVSTCLASPMTTYQMSSSSCEWNPTPCGRRRIVFWTSLLIDKIKRKDLYTVVFPLSCPCHPFLSIIVLTDTILFCHQRNRKYDSDFSGRVITKARFSGDVPPPLPPHRFLCCLNIVNTIFYDLWGFSSHLITRWNKWLAYLAYSLSHFYSWMRNWD